MDVKRIPITRIPLYIEEEEKKKKKKKYWASNKTWETGIGT
jgi:hypothetical protein